MRNISACLSHNTDDWKTPSNIYNAFIENGYIDCFPYESDYDEMEYNYFGKKLFINPPFSKMNSIVDWIIDQAHHNVVALLIPARTDTNYFHKLCKLFPLIYFIKGRLHYNDSNCAPFPTILMVFSRLRYLPLYNFITQEELICRIKNL